MTPTPPGRVVACVVLLAVVGCSSEPARWTIEEPALRLVPERAPPPTGVAYGDPLEIDGEERRALASLAQTRGVAHESTDGPVRGFRVTGLPPAVLAWGRGVVERQGVVDGLKRMLSDAVPFGPPGQETFVPFRKGERALTSMFVTVRSVAAMRDLEVVTAPFVVAPGAVLSFAVGVDTPTWSKVDVKAQIEVLESDGAQTAWSERRTGANHAWRDRRVSLAPWTGRTIRLRFRSRPSSFARPSTVAVFGAPTVLVPDVVPLRPLNVVLISMDTLRARSVGTYGCELPTTPAIDALARDGVVFENAFSSAAYTLPGHVSMMTGLSARSHGLIRPAQELDRTRRSLPELLERTGRATGGFIAAAAWLDPEAGFRFDTLAGRPPPFGPPARPEPSDTFTRGLEWIDARGGQPFFAFLHNFQVHRPYQTGPPYDELFGPKTYGLTPDEARLRYEQEVRYADDQVRALLDALAWSGLLDRTLVILTSDHGEAFFEHGWMEHTHDVHDEIARVPLIMRLPGALPAGRRIAEPVSLVDIMPTVLDLLGLPPADGVDGMSLLPLMTGAGDRLPREGVFTEAESSFGLGWTDLVAFHGRTHTCIRWGGTGDMECYDARRDPWQLGPPLPDDAAAPGLAEARAATVHRLEKPLVGGSIDQGLDPERREQLRALGYIE